MTALVLGTSRLGSDPADPEGAGRTALALLASGLLIDTSNAYASGRSEAALGRALAALPSAEKDAAAARILTKVDADAATGVFDADRVRRSAEESLERLGVDRIPLLHLHDPYTITPSEAFAPGGAVEGLVRLKEEGIAGSIGVAAAPIPLMRRYVDSGVFDAVLVHNRFTLVDDSAAALFADAKDRGMTVFNAAPFGGDLLVKGPRDGATYAYRPIGDDLAAWTSALFDICAGYSIPPAAVALRFSTRAPFIDRTVVGVSSPARLAELLAFDGVTIPEQLWADIAALGAAASSIEDPEVDA